MPWFEVLQVTPLVRPLLKTQTSLHDNWCRNLSLIRYIIYKFVYQLNVVSISYHNIVFSTSQPLLKQPSKTIVLNCLMSFQVDRFFYHYRYFCRFWNNSWTAFHITHPLKKKIWSPCHCLLHYYYNYHNLLILQIANTWADTGTMPALYVLWMCNTNTTYDELKDQISHMPNIFLFWVHSQMDARTNQ